MNLIKLYKLQKKMKEEPSNFLTGEYFNKIIPAFCNQIGDSVIKEKEEPFNRDEYYKELREFFTAYGREHADEIRKEFFDD